MSRSVDIWVGATDDTSAPPRVRARVFEHCGGRCHRCGRKIRPGEGWTLEHMIALVNGGRNAEDNLDVTCAWCLPAKNADDMAIKSHGTKVRYRHMGIKTRSGPPFPAGRQSKFKRRMDGTVVLRDTGERRR